MSWSFYDRFWSFYSIANYINIFHKTEVPTVILRCLTSRNLKWIKSYIWHKSYIFLTTVFFNLGRKKTENSSFKNGHFLTICGHVFGNYIDIFHKTEIQMVILRCLVCLKPWHYYWLNFFFHAWKCIISGVKYRCKFWHLSRKQAVIFSIWLFFQNSLMMS